MRKLMACAFVVTLAASSLSAQRVIFTPHGVLPILDAYLESLRIQAGIPGMSAAVVKDGVIVWEKGYGFQNLPARIRATPDTPYMIGDMSATVAATLLLQCVEHRRLELDRPLGTYAGLEIPEGQATLRQLLSHTGVAMTPELFTYNPARFAQLGAVMEWCAPQPYRKSVSHRILNHLVMHDSAPGTDLRDPLLPLPEGLYDPVELQRYRDVLERVAVPYKIDMRGRAERTELAPEPISAAGGLVSTVRDLARFDAALDHAVAPLLLESTREQAWHPALTGSGQPLPSGLGWFVQSYRGKRVVWHFGMITNAYSSLIVKLPDENLTFILLANSDRLSSSFQLSSGEISRSLFALVFLKLVT